MTISTSTNAEIEAIEAKINPILTGLPNLSDIELINLFMQLSEDRGVAYFGIVPFDRIADVLEDKNRKLVEEFIDLDVLNLHEIFADDVDEQIKSAFLNFEEDYIDDPVPVPGMFSAVLTWKKKV